MFSLSQALINGVVLSAIFGVIVVISLYRNPRLWIQDFPKEIQATQSPLTPQEKREKAVLSVLIVGIMLGAPLYIVAQLRASGGSPSFFEAYASIWIAYQIVMLFDAIVIDWLWLVEFQPKFVVLPGAEGLTHLLSDKRMHLNNYVKSVVGTTIGAIPYAIIAAMV